MPVHVVAGHLAIVLAPIAALLALLYATVPSARAAARWPLLGGALLAMAVVAWAGEAGKELLARIEAGGPAPEVAAANAHAKGSDALAVAVFLLLALTATFAWWVLRPGRPSTAGSLVATVLLAGAAVAVLVTTATTTASALTAVWDHHPSWSGRP